MNFYRAAIKLLDIKSLIVANVDETFKLGLVALKKFLLKGRSSEVIASVMSLRLIIPTPGAKRS